MGGNEKKPLHPLTEKNEVLHAIIQQLCDQTPICTTYDWQRPLIAYRRERALTAAQYGRIRYALMYATDAQLPVDQIEAAVVLLFGRLPPQIVFPFSPD